MKETVIPVVVGALGTVPKDLERELKVVEIRGWIETIQTTDQPEYWAESWGPEETFYLLDSRKRILAYDGENN